MKTEEEICRDFSLAEDTFSIATSLFGMCSQKHKPHIFRVDADLVGVEVCKKLHGNARGGKFALNYKLTVAIQQMGNGVSQMETLYGFLDLPLSTSLWSQIGKADELLGKVQIEKME